MLGFNSHFSSVWQTPTLVIYGELDTNLGAQSHKNLIQLPHHTVVKLAGARHACYMDKPREFHRALLDFLSKLEWGSERVRTGRTNMWKDFGRDWVKK